MFASTEACDAQLETSCAPDTLAVCFNFVADRTWERHAGGLGDRGLNEHSLKTFKSTNEVL